MFARKRTLPVSCALVAMLVMAPGSATAERRAGAKTDGRLVGAMLVERGTGTSDEDIFLLGTDGHRTRNLTRAGFRQDGPAWSPDGRLIAFSSPYGLHVMRSDGSGERSIVRSHSVGERHFFPMSPAWSPDGTHLAFRELVFENGAWGTASLKVVSLEGTGLRSLVESEPSAFLYGPRWSPDGEQIVFGQCSYGDIYAMWDCRIEVIDAEGSDHRSLTPLAPSQDLNPTWTSDGQIAFISDRGCYEDPAANATVCRAVYSMQPDGSEVKEIAPPEDWNGDGRLDVPLRLVPSSAKPHVMVVALSHDASDATELWRWNTATGAKERVFDGDVGSDFDWQPLCTVRGTHGDDVLRGTDRRDRICGLGGDDRIKGLGGDDVIFGHAGDDQIDGGRGADIVLGNAGRDRCVGDRRDHSNVC